jgi:hypothetical protein
MLPPIVLINGKSYLSLVRVITGQAGLTIENGRNSGERLKLIRGGYPRRIQTGSLTIVASFERDPPFKVDAMAVEEDTFLVLSADRRVRNVREPLIKVMTRVISTQPRRPGSVIVQERTPLRLLAIIHDLNEEPSWREDWITSALEEIFHEAERRKLRSIGIPFLGTLHGTMKKRRFLVLLRSSIERVFLHHLKQLWLVVPTGTSCKLFEVFEGL